VSFTKFDLIFRFTVVQDAHCKTLCGQTITHFFTFYLVPEGPNEGAMTFCITTFSIMAVSITTLSIRAFSIRAFSITALSITAFSITAFSITINKIPHSAQ
jgi:hypothetical protein